MKEPEARLSLQEVMQHPWVTCQGTQPLPTMADSGLQVCPPPLLFRIPPVPACVPGHAEVLLPMHMACTSPTQLTVAFRV